MNCLYFIILRQLTCSPLNHFAEDMRIATYKAKKKCCLRQYSYFNDLCRYCKMLSTPLLSKE